MSHHVKAIRNPKIILVCNWHRREFPYVKHPLVWGLIQPSDFNFYEKLMSPMLMETEHSGKRQGKKVIMKKTQRLENLRFDDDNVNDNATNPWFDRLHEEKWSCCTYSTLFGAMFWRSLPNADVKFSYLRLRRQRELAAVNLSLFAFTWKPFVPS